MSVYKTLLVSLETNPVSPVLWLHEPNLTVCRESDRIRSCLACYAIHVYACTVTSVTPQCIKPPSVKTCCQVCAVSHSALTAAGDCWSLPFWFLLVV